MIGVIGAEKHDGLEKTLTLSSPTLFGVEGSYQCGTPKRLHLEVDLKAQSLSKLNLLCSTM